jgi:hypothetical protein
MPDVGGSTALRIARYSAAALSFIAHHEVPASSFLGHRIAAMRLLKGLQRPRAALTRFVFAAVVIALTTVRTFAADEYVLRTNPPVAGATVFVDGESVGTTDANGKAAVVGAPGTHQIRVDYQGETCSAEMTFDAELNSLPEFVMRDCVKTPEPGSAQNVSYTIDTNVADATVSIDGESGGLTDSAGRATLMLTPGAHSVGITKAGFESQTSPIEVLPQGGQLSVALQSTKRPRFDLILLALVSVLVVSIALLVFVAIRRSRSSARLTNTRAAYTGDPTGGLFDRYRLAGALGSGGVGTIYRAFDLLDKTLIALKVLDARWLSDPDMVRKFLAEGEALRAIAARDASAPVVKCFRYGREHDSIVGRPFISLELLEGETLQNRLAREPAVDETTYVAIGYQIATALIAVHSAGIVHRDLTPDNVFLRNGEVRVREQRFASVPAVVLIDFGIARQELMSRLTMDGSIAGKPHFMSPEQCRGIQVDARSDLYSLGVILYLMATGRLPFGGRDPFEVMRAQQAEPPAPLPPHVNSYYADLCSRLLQKDRETRPESAAIASAELADILVSIGTANAVNIVSFPNRRVSL